MAIIVQACPLGTQLLLKLRIGIHSHGNSTMIKFSVSVKSDTYVVTKTAAMLLICKYSMPIRAQHTNGP